MASKRLSQADWIEAGLDALAERGPAALQAEVLARELGTTKGSFYWHFKDLAAFHGAVAREWKRRAAEALVDALEAKGADTQRLIRVSAPATAEQAMRAWALQNSDAAGELGEIDALRLDATAAILRDFDISNPDIARALYAAGIGVSALPGNARTGAKAMSTLVDLVLALR